MSLTYTGTNGLFTHVGKLVKHYNQCKTDAMHATTGLDADRNEILDAFQAANQDIAIDGLVGAVERWKNEYIGRRGELFAFALKRLQDKDTVLDEISASSNGQDEILAKLIEAMDDDGASILGSSVSIGSVTADADNQGGGAILTTAVLDGVSSPGAINDVTMPAQTLYSGLNTQLAAQSQKFRLRVTADSFQDGLEEGSEEITWDGSLVDQPHGIGEEGSGIVATIQPINAVTANHVSNADFESFTGNLPDNWDLVSGVAGTNVLAAGSSHASHGANALLYQGNASATSIELKQSISKSQVVGRKRYCVAVRVKKASATTGTLTIQFEGTGYSAGATEKISKAVSAIGTSFGQEYFFVNMPARIPDDLRLVIRWSGGTPGASEKVYLDDLAVGPVSYGGGFGLVAVRNSAPFVRDDQFDFTVTNTEGVFQAFFRRTFGVQLPSHATTPTIADSLAQ